MDPRVFSTIHPLRSFDELSVPFAFLSRYPAVNIGRMLTESCILLEETTFLVVNKPAGILTQAAPGIPSMEVLLRELLAARPDTTNTPSLGLPHRLDRGTSGALLIARNERSLKRFGAQFQSRKIHKGMSPGSKERSNKKRERGGIAFAKYRIAPWRKSFLKITPTPNKPCCIFVACGGNRQVVVGHSLGNGQNASDSNPMCKPRFFNRWRLVLR